MLTSDINSVTPIIYLMMFIQIFEAGIEDEFAWENTKEEQNNGRTSQLFQSGIPTISITQAK